MRYSCVTPLESSEPASSLSSAGTLRSERKAIQRPSGDHCGSVSCPDCVSCVRRWLAAPESRYSHRSLRKNCFSQSAWEAEMTTAWPSGEILKWRISVALKKSSSVSGGFWAMAADGSNARKARVRKIRFRMARIYIRRRKKIKAHSDLEHVTVAGHHQVENGIEEEAEEQSRDEAGDNHDGEWLLCIRSDASRKRRRQQAKTGNERRHHDGTQAQEGSLACRGFDVHAFEPQLVDVGDENHAGFDRNAEEGEQSKPRRHAKRRVGELQCQKCTCRNSTRLNSSHIPLSR